MELIIQNLGPIKGNQQSIDLSKKFFIFLGYNNSGKTYVSQLLWTIFNEEKQRKFATSSYAKGYFNELIKSSLDENRIEITSEFVESLLENFSDFLQDEIFDTYNLEKSSSKLGDVSFSLSSNLEELKGNNFTMTIGINIKDEYSIPNYLEMKKETDSNTIRIEQNPLSEELLKTIPKDIQLSYYHILRDQIEDKCKLMIVSILQILLNSPHDKTFFLPASRAFFPVFYQYIYDIERKNREKLIQEFMTLIESKKKKEIALAIQDVSRKIFRRSYTEPMNKVIESLYSLNDDQSAVTFYDLHLETIAKIMGGDIILKQLEGIAPVQFYFRFKENKQEIDLPMYLASSSANQLTLLYLYFKYWAREKGNFLIIDEPEVNLHPENQIKLLDLLINFVSQSDNKVLIATHSSLLADAVNNYLYIDNLRQYYDDKQIKEIIADNELQYLYPDTKLSREDLGVYFFTGDEIVSYDRGHYGIYFRNFKEATNSLQKSARILTDFIYGKENEEE
jgi:predicted ATP-dependent endonuclease of OLD family